MLQGWFSLSHTDLWSIFQCCLEWLFKTKMQALTLNLVCFVFSLLGEGLREFFVLYVPTVHDITWNTKV